MASNPTAEAGNETVIDDRHLAVQKRGVSILERFLSEGTADPLERLDKMAEVLDRLRRLSIAQTYPSDWIIHASTDPDGTVLAERGYLQDIGADRAGKVWGIQVSEPVIELEQFEDGTFAVHMLADAYCRVTGEMVPNVEGSRWSGDKFFRKSVGPDEKVDPVDVRKSAYANLHGRAVRALAGLGGVALEALAKAGLDTTKCVRINYAPGARGGEATGASAGGAAAGLGPVINFGKSKNKHVSELTNKDLTWYQEAVTKSIADPTKAQWQDRNQKLLDAIDAEIERRKHPAAAAPPGNAAPAADRGARSTAVFKRLGTAAGTVGVGELLHVLIGKKSLTDLTDDELGRVEAMADDDFANVAATLQERG